MARCNDCNKFVSYDDSTEPEVENIDITPDAITGEIRIVLNCAECSNELREGRFEFDIDISEDFGEKHEGEGHDLEVNTEFIELTTHQQTTDGKGKFVPARFRKSFYGYSAEFLVTCSCGHKQSYDSAESTQASYLEEV